MAIDTEHSRKSHRIAASWAGVAAALLATGALATTVVAGGSPATPRQDPPTTTPARAVDGYVVHADGRRIARHARALGRCL